MKFFVDTADIADIKELADTGLLDGVTTNPSLIAKSGRDFMEVTKEICDIVDGPVSAEVVALDHDTMMKEAETLRKIADNVCIKVPLTVDGLKTCKALSGEGTPGGGGIGKVEGIAPCPHLVGQRGQLVFGPRHEGHAPAAGDGRTGGGGADPGGGACDEKRLGHEVLLKSMKNAAASRGVNDRTACRAQMFRPRAALRASLTNRH